VQEWHEKLSFSKPLKGPHCAGHTFAIADSTFAAHFNLQDRLAEMLIVNDRDIESNGLNFAPTGFTRLGITPSKVTDNPFGISRRLSSTFMPMSGLQAHG